MAITGWAISLCAVTLRPITTRTVVAARPIARMLSGWTITRRSISSTDTDGLRTAALGTFLARTSGSTFAWRTRRLFTPGSNRGERDAAAVFVDFDDPHLQHVAHADDFVRIADVAIGEPADMNQAAVGQTDIDEHAEVDHVEHGGLQFHAGLQIFELSNTAAEQRRRETFARVETGPPERIQNVAQQVRADL